MKAVLKDAIGSKEQICYFFSAQRLYCDLHPEYGTFLGYYPMDETDRKILRVLQDDPSLSIADMAKKVGLSHTPCWRRVKQMEDAGIIRGRALLLDPELLGLSVTVLANVRLKAHDEATLEAFEKAAAKQPAIVDCFTMGGESDYALRIVVGSIDEYERLLKKTLLHFPGVGAMSSHFALKRVKNTTKLPI